MGILRHPAASCGFQADPSCTSYFFLEVATNTGRYLVITFCVSRRRRKMYCGHAHLCVCLSVCPRLYAHTTARTRM